MFLIIEFYNKHATKIKADREILDMKLIIVVLLLLPISIYCQNTFTAKIKDEDSKAVLRNVSVMIKVLKKSAVSDTMGFLKIKDIPNGIYVLEFSHVGYKELEKSYSFPLKGNDSVEVNLEPDIQSLEEVTVITTRSNRSISNTATRIEIISDEEIHEEGEMRPGDIKMLLNESTGVQTQQTSATSGNASLRLQGLDGRYTQILKDGFPIFSGAASGLGLLQTPPLDLRQVEIIKGSSSTLYGGGAIAGLINLISKVPQSKRELSFHINGTTAKGLDINSFYSQQFDEVGVTLFAARNSNGAFAPGNTIFTAIPKFERYTFNPKVFLKLSEKTKMNIGINSSFENRLGGDILYIEGKGDNTHSYFEENKTNRVSSELSFDHAFSNSTSLNIKNSFSYFDRNINAPSYNFKGIQHASFSEVSFLNKRKRADWVGGFNFLTDNFRQQPNSSNIITDYKQTTIGAFAQNTWNADARLTFETGVRGDYIKDYGFIVLPRFSALYKFSEKLSSRISGGFGYKTPSIFTEETERLLYKNIRPVSHTGNQLERSYGVTADLSYKTILDKLRISINQFFFYTYLSHPLQLYNFSITDYQLLNIPGHINTKGIETNVKLSYEETSLYLGYTLTDAHIVNFGNSERQPLTPIHRINAALVYEIEKKWKIGSELYYYSKQQLTDGRTGREFWLSGLVVERLINNISVYVNFENFGNIRQSKFETIYTGPVSNPSFKDIYAPLDGFIANGGIKIKL